MSLFSKRVWEYRAARIPRFTARANEKADRGYAPPEPVDLLRKGASVPSPEPLSTTIICESYPSSSRTSPGRRRASKSFPSRDGITTEIPRGREAPGAGTDFRFIRRFRQKARGPCLTRIRAGRAHGGQMGASPPQKRIKPTAGASCHRTKFFVRHAKWRAKPSVAACTRRLVLSLL